MNNPKLIQLKENTHTLIKTSQALQQEALALRATLKINMAVLRTSIVAFKTTTDKSKNYIRLQKSG